MRTLVIAPHPDDETLGVGGTLLKRRAEGHEIAWVIATKVTAEDGWSHEIINTKENEISKVADFFGFHNVFRLNYATTRLDQYAMASLVASISNVFKEFQPNEVFIPHRGDVHTDHRYVYDASVSCTKWFRYPSVKRVLAYETLSETDFGFGADQSFLPNVFVDIEKYIDQKINIMDIYSSELGAFPFPRSEESIRALAKVRGVAAGYQAAEAFQLLRERQ